jgi:hypothetical protein
MKYFQYFPKIDYTFTNTDGTLTTLSITNPTVHVKIVERLKQHIEVFHDYVIADGERPDTVATNLYGSPDYTWVVLIVNNIFSLYDWPLTYDEFVLFIVDKYGSLAAAQAQSVYKTTDGDYIDAVSYGLLSADQQGSVISAYDDELAKNEDKRRIRVIPAQFVEPLVLELRKVLA